MKPEWRDSQPRPCHTCGGSGKRETENIIKPCFICRGSGRLYIDVGRWNYRKFHPADNEPSYSP